MSRKIRNVTPPRNIHNSKSNSSQSLSLAKPRISNLIYKSIYKLFLPPSRLDSKSYGIYRDVSIFAILNICFMICVFTPYAVYSSDVSQFDASQTYSILSVLFGCFFALITWTYLPHKLFI